MQGQRTFGFMILNIYYEYSSCSINNQNMINRNYMIDKNEIRSEISFDFKKITPSIMLTSVNKKNNNDETLNGQKLHLSIDFLGPKKVSLNSPKTKDEILAKPYAIIKLIEISKYSLIPFSPVLLSFGNESTVLPNIMGVIRPKPFEIIIQKTAKITLSFKSYLLLDHRYGFNNLKIL